jgi:hypothetical protein
MTGSTTTRSISDEQIRAATGKTWAEWHTVLDDWGAKEQRLVPIANYLRHNHRLTLTWAQVVAVYYKWGDRLGRQPARR